MVVVKWLHGQRSGHWGALLVCVCGPGGGFAGQLGVAEEWNDQVDPQERFVRHAELFWKCRREVGTPDRC